MTAPALTAEDVARWNACLLRGDADEIAAIQDALLQKIHWHIMDDDPNYARAGWKGQPLEEETANV